MPKLIALTPTDLNTSRLGLPSLVGRQLAGRPVLAHTVSRLASIEHVDAVVVLHPPGQDPSALLGGLSLPKPVHYCETPSGWADEYTPMEIAARKWSLSSWRGGLGGATCYDELLPASALAYAMEQVGSDVALIAGGDWPLVDPDVCRRVIELHLTDPEEMQMTFCQAPPGLAGVLAKRELVEQFAENHVGFGRVLAYNPSRPQADPIGRDVCVRVDPVVRGCARRFVYDTKRSAAMIDAVAARLGDGLASADAKTVARAALDVEAETRGGSAPLPQQVTLELTPRRPAAGPIVPQHYVSLERDDMPLDVALGIVNQLGADGDTLLTLGGLGDAVRHEHWRQVVTAACDAGVLGVCIETDLLDDTSVVDDILSAPVDIVSVRVNADTADTYRSQMTDPSASEQEGRFLTLTNNLQHMLRERNQRWQETGPAVSDADDPQRKPGVPWFPGVPWIVPRLIKTAATLKDMETFFERWLTFSGHAVIEPATTGCGLMPDLAPMSMAPPRRFACRQLLSRMTIHSDGRVPTCDQDWTCRACAGDATRTPLVDIWQAMNEARQAHNAGRWNDLELCDSCREWHRP